MSVLHVGAQARGGSSILNSEFFQEAEIQEKPTEYGYWSPMREINHMRRKETHNPHRHICNLNSRIPGVALRHCRPS